MKGKKLLLMGSSAFRAEVLPREVRDRIDDAMAENMTVIVGEAPEANIRLVRPHKGIPQKAKTNYDCR